MIVRRQEQLTQIPAEPMSREDLEARHRADAEDLRLATETFTWLGAEILDADPASQRLRLAGTVEQLSRIFGLEEVTSSGPHGHDITTGNNGTDKAATGWDPCTGLSSPDGRALLADADRPTRIRAVDFTASLSLAPWIV